MTNKSVILRAQTKAYGVWKTGFKSMVLIFGKLFPTLDFTFFFCQKEGSWAIRTFQNAFHTSYSLVTGPEGDGLALEIML